MLSYTGDNKLGRKSSEQAGSEDGHHGYKVRLPAASLRDPYWGQDYLAPLLRDWTPNAELTKEA